MDSAQLSFDFWTAVVIVLVVIAIAVLVTAFAPEDDEDASGWGPSVKFSAHKT